MGVNQNAGFAHNKKFCTLVRQPHLLFRILSLRRMEKTGSFAKATFPFCKWLLFINWPLTMPEYSPQLGQHCPGILTDFSQATFWISQSYILWQVCLPDWHWHCWQYMLLLSADSFSTSALAPSLNNRPLIWQLRACSSGLTGTENDNDYDNVNDSRALAQLSTMGKKICLPMHPRNRGSDDSSERPYVLHVSGCEISHLIARSPRHILCMFNGIGHPCYGQLTANKINRQFETHQWHYESSWPITSRLNWQTINNITSRLNWLIRSITKS